MEGDIGVCGVALLLSFLCGIPVNKIPHCGVAVISNPTVCDFCAFKPTVFGETKLFAVLRHQQYQYSLHADRALWTVYITLWCVCRVVPNRRQPAELTGYLVRLCRLLFNYFVPLPGQI